MIFFPLFHTVDRQRVIRILRGLIVNIDYHQGQKQFPGIDLVHCAQTFDEMRWWIDVHPPLADMRENFGEKTGAHCVWPFIVPINSLARFLRKTGPVWYARREFVC